MNPVSADRVCDVNQICVLCGCNFVDWDDEELEMCEGCSESDQVDKDPSDPTIDQIEAAKMQIRREKRELLTFATREAELAYRKSLKRIGKGGELKKSVIKQKRAKIQQREMFE